MSRNTGRNLQTAAVLSAAVQGLAAMAFLLFGACETAPSSIEDQPNIVVIMVDDLGWMDLHCQGNERLDTPNIDRLAARGMRFTDAYSAAPVCSPTRAAMMTGQSPARLGLTTHIPDRPAFWPEDAGLQSARTLDHLPLEHVTIAERLKGAGYATAFFGKWHLSGRSRRGDQGMGDPAYQPEHQGFDVNVGGCAYGGPPTYFDPYRIYNIKPRRKGEYLPDRLADEAMDFVRAHRNKPFFLALWHYTVHWPMEAPGRLIEKYEKRIGHGLKDPRYGAMIEAMDAAVGRIMTLLDELELSRRTLVVFTSDNGGYLGVADNRPLRSGKGYLYEGGIRVPLIMKWPGVVPAGTTCDTPVITTDLYPTFLDAAGLEPLPDTQLDGESLLPLMMPYGEAKGGDVARGTLRRDALFFHYPNYAWHRSNRLGAAIREGDYKLIKWYEDDSVELYNLAEDLGETEDLAGAEPGLSGRLKGRLEAWLEDSGAVMPEPVAVGPESNPER